jgi:hypothetical protein
MTASREGLAQDTIEEHQGMSPTTGHGDPGASGSRPGVDVQRQPALVRVAGLNETDAVPGRLRNPSRLALWRSGLGGAASHLGGLALCGSVPRLRRT